jgi:small subunit ribosomal protein S6
MAITSNYETLLVLSLSLGEEGVNNLVEKFKGLISGNGEISSVDVWGKRKLAYEIKDETEGYYVLINFSCANDFPAELDRVYKITDGVLRSLIIKK